MLRGDCFSVFIDTLATLSMTLATGCFVLLFLFLCLLFYKVSFLFFSFCQLCLPTSGHVALYTILLIALSPICVVFKDSFTKKKEKKREKLEDGFGPE